MVSKIFNYGIQFISGIRTGIRAANALSAQESKVSSVAKTKIFQAASTPPDRSSHPLGYHVTPDYKPFLYQMNKSPDGLLVARPGSSINAGSVGGLFVNLQSPDHAVDYAKGLLGTKKDLYILDIGAHEHTLRTEETYGHTFISAGSEFQILGVSHVKAEDLTPPVQDQRPTVADRCSAFMRGFRAEVREQEALPPRIRRVSFPCPYNIAPDGEVELSTGPVPIM
jgi:hypothetical protein